jgi:tyrosyl-tRNA synthetase
MMLAHLQRAGHVPIAVVGGATGMIGDPSGRSSERQFLTPDELAQNEQAIHRQLARFLDFDGDRAATLVNNADWTRPISYLDWLRDVGKHFSVNAMIAKESVRRRLEDRDQGISYTEFSYMLLQAHDFLVLHDRLGCTLQVGGNDQWGNITAGIDLIRRKRGAEVFGVTAPLITTSTGEKFGKSAGNAVWLDAAMTSPYHFYQYWIQTPDSDVERYLRLFTFLGIPEIVEICRVHEEQKSARVAQRTLAREVTRTVHGEAGLHSAKLATEILFGREISGLSDAELSGVFADVPSASLSRQALSEGLDIVTLLTATELAKSKGEARRIVQAGGVYLNNRRFENVETPITSADLASETMLVLRSGKKSYAIVRFGELG